jgi:hypothetical protein
MAKHLQIGIQINTDADPEPEVNVTPVDTTVVSKAADGLETAILLADLNDAVPGSGVYEVDTKIAFPIRLFGRTFTFNYPARVTVKVVDK